MPEREGAGPELGLLETWERDVDSGGDRQARRWLGKGKSENSNSRKMQIERSVGTERRGR